MILPEINLETNVIIGISVMLLLFSSFLILFIISQRKKLQFHKQLQSLNEKQQAFLTEQNALLEKRVHEKTVELSKQAELLQQSLTNLRETQRHLVQREKMASLGELTAGIAHEIQNPLNFVNNFAEVSAEILTELHKIAFINLPVEYKAEAEEMFSHVIDNLEKINHHGKRADSIVKGMLLHSRVSTGQKQPTDVNNLVEEYLRLSYHGLRAKDKSFNAAIHSAYASNLPLVTLNPPEIGRVLLNLYNNAFYSVKEKHKQAVDSKEEPAIFVETERIEDHVVIKIRDNGTGIPPKVLEKIYQPFFTTKPAGQGTGLGLSLSYDIIKAHGGDLKVINTEGQGAEFIIYLPVVK